MRPPDSSDNQNVRYLPKFTDLKSEQPLISETVAVVLKVLGAMLAFIMVLAAGYATLDEFSSSAAANVATALEEHKRQETEVLKDIRLDVKEIRQDIGQVKIDLASIKARQ